MENDKRGDADRGQVMAEAAKVYQEFFVPALFGQWADPVADAADIRGGQRILDIGCGTGVLTRRVAERAGTEGGVVGLDPNPGMLAVAAGQGDGSSRSATVTWQQGVVEQLPFDDGSFDTVVSQFAVMFFDDHRRAAAETRRVLATGGRIAVAAWAGLDETPGYAEMVRLLDRLFGVDAAEALRAPYRLGDPSALQRTLASDFTDLEVTRHDGVARFDSIEAWVHTDIRGWTLSGMVDDEAYERLLSEAHTDLARFTTASGAVEFAAPALICTGRPR